MAKKNKVIRSATMAAKAATLVKDRLAAASKVARTTTLAAGLATAQWVAGEERVIERVFDPTWVDRLQAPISRYHD